jgi:hypothetical protein
VVGILVSLLVGGVEAVQRRLTGAVASVYGAFETALLDAGLALDSAFTTAGTAVLVAQARVNTAIVNTAESAGLAAPVTAAILFTIGVVATFALLRAGLNAVKWIT